jgi:hypothetical protein
MVYGRRLDVRRPIVAVRISRMKRMVVVILLAMERRRRRRRERKKMPEMVDAALMGRSRL